MNRPEYISLADWNLLIDKYKDNLNLLEEKLNKYYPVQYLIGDVDFFGNKILVNENVLIPRYETELLVENTIKLIKENNFKNLKVLDIGTGSGCIAISLAKELETSVTAIDISKKALDIAKQNANNNDVNITFIEKDILNENIDGMFDLLISNPPYIKIGEVVDPRTQYEPQNALFAENDGLIFYETILNKSKGHLNKNGIIAFEIGMDQKESIKKLVKNVYPNAKVIVKKDYLDRDRMIFIINKE